MQVIDERHTIAVEDLERLLDKDVPCVIDDCDHPAAIDALCCNDACPNTSPRTMCSCCALEFLQTVKIVWALFRKPTGCYDCMYESPPQGFTKNWRQL